MGYIVIPRRIYVLYRVHRYTQKDICVVRGTSLYVEGYLCCTGYIAIRRKISVLYRVHRYTQKDICDVQGTSLYVEGYVCCTWYIVIRRRISDVGLYRRFEQWFERLIWPKLSEIDPCQ